MLKLKFYETVLDQLWSLARKENMSVAAYIVKVMTEHATKHTTAQ